MAGLADIWTGTGAWHSAAFQAAVSRVIHVTAFFVVLTITLAVTTVAVDISTSGSSQTAFNGPHSLPGIVQAEDFDNGGPGVAYYDTTSVNKGGAYRTNEGVDIETQGGVTNLAYVINNEWTEYTVHVAETGTYSVDFRVGSWSNGRAVSVSFDGNSVATVNVPNTGSYSAFETVSVSIPFTAGLHVIRLTYLGDGQNIDCFEVKSAVSDASFGQTAYHGPHMVPGRIEAEDYDNGGPEVAYSDSTTSNMGGAGRSNEGVDVVCDGSVTGISWIYDDEWTEYTVEVSSSGLYAASFRVGSPGPGQQIVVTVDGATGCTVSVPITGSYSAYTTVSAPLGLTAGTHVIRLTYRISGYGQVIDWFELLGGSPTGVVTTVPITVPTIVPTTVPSMAPTAVPSTLPPTASPTIGSGMSSTQAAVMVSSAKTESYSRLISMQAAARAWSVPSRPDLVAVGVDVGTRGLKSGGVTDNTAVLQSLLNTLPSGATLYFPAGTYRLDGPISISKPVTICGESGTVFNCKNAVKNVFTVNRYGSASSKMGGVLFTGIVFEGPGNESDPAMIDAYYLNNLRVSFVKFHNLGYAGLRVNTCTDAVIEDCVFDDIFKTGYGYGICITDRSDGVVIRDNFFITQGRHGVTTGTSNPSLSSANYIRGVTVENNYFEYMTRSATDTHDVTYGPVIVRNNVYYNCETGVGLRAGGADISDNTMVQCMYGVYVYDLTETPSVIEPRVISIVRNRLIDGRGDGMVLKFINTYVAENIIDGQDKTVGQIGIYVDNRNYVPITFRVERNIVDDCRHSVYIRGTTSAISCASNYLI